MFSSQALKFDGICHAFDLCILNIIGYTPGKTYYLPILRHRLILYNTPVAFRFRYDGETSFDSPGSSAVEWNFH